MASAAKSISVSPVAVEPGQVPLPGDAELFAAMVAGASKEGTPSEDMAPEAKSETGAETPEPVIDASILLPLLDQQRASTPAAKLVTQSADSPAPASVRITVGPAATVRPVEAPAEKAEVTDVTNISGRGRIRPALIDGKTDVPVAVAPKAAVTDAPPVMHPLNGGKAAPAIVDDAVPVMRPLDRGKAASATVSDAAPVLGPRENSKAATSVAASASIMLPIEDGKAAAPATDAPRVMPPRGGGKAAPAPATDAPQMMRPIEGGTVAPKPATEAALVMRPIEGEKTVPDPATDASAIMRPIEDGRAASAPVTEADPMLRPVEGRQAVPAPVTDALPVMRQAAKPAAAAVTEPAPVLHAAKAATTKADVVRPDALKAGNLEAVVTAAKIDPQGASNTQPVQPTASVHVEAKTAASIAVPATQAQPLPAASQPKAVAKAADAKAPATQAQPLPVAPQPKPVAKAIGSKVPTPEAEAAALAGTAGPIAAKGRAARAPAVPVELRLEPGSPDTAPVATATTETRAAVQPLHAAPPLAQALAAPGGVPAPNVAAALSQQVLDMSGGDAWIDQLARDLSQAAGKDGTMRFRLAPETLGELKVEISHSERGAHVRLNVSSETAQQALAAAEHKLAAEARAQGVRIAETEINFTGGQSQGRDASTFAREQGQQQAQASHQPRTPRGNSANTFTSSAAAPEGRGRTDRYA